LTFDNSLFLLVAPPPTHIPSLSLHDALPICRPRRAQCVLRGNGSAHPLGPAEEPQHRVRVMKRRGAGADPVGFCLAHMKDARARSEEHTSELQSRENLVCRLLLEKQKTTDKN